MSRAKTEQEMQEEFLKQVKSLVKYWDSQDMSSEQKLDGLAFSILTIIDGDTLLPAYSLIPLTTKEDTEYFKSNGENYYPKNVDIAGELHAQYCLLNAQESTQTSK
jgi:hypothetical protein